MSTDARSEPSGSYWLSGGLIFAGVVALGVTATMNAHFGKSLALSEVGQDLQQASSLVADGMAALMAVVVGSFWRARRRTAAAVAGAVMCAFAAYSMVSVIGFGASERIGKSARDTATVTAEADATKAANAEAAKSREDLRRWLRDMTLTRRPGDQKPLIEAVERAATIPIVVKAVPATVTVDQQASVLASLVRWKLEHVQVTLIVWLSVLLVLAKVSGFGFGAFLMPRKALKAHTVSSATKDEETFTSSIRDDHTAAETVNDDPDTVRDQVRQFVKVGLTEDDRVSTPAGEVYQAYVEWCAAAGLDATQPNRWKFAKALRAACQAEGITIDTGRIAGDGKSTYRGLALRGGCVKAA